MKACLPPLKAKASAVLDEVAFLVSVDVVHVAIHLMTRLALAGTARDSDWRSRLANTSLCQSAPSGEGWNPEILRHRLPHHPRLPH